MNLYVPEPVEGYVESAGLYVPAEYARTRLPTCIDLFAGAGGFSCGMMKAGFHAVAASEGDHGAALTYLANLGGPRTVVHVLPGFDGLSKQAMAWHEQHAGESMTAAEFFDSTPAAKPAKQAMAKDPADRKWGPGVGWITSERDHEVGACAGHIDEPEEKAWFCHAYCEPPPHREPVQHYYLGDVRHLTGEMILADLGRELGDIDCIVGGPPCQGFSFSGRRNVVDPRNAMVFEFVRLVLEVRPRTMVMENVPGILSMTTPEGVPVVDALCRVLEDGGWGTYDVLRRALTAQAKAMGVMRGKSGPAPEPDVPDNLDDEEQAEDVKQLAFAIEGGD